MVQMGQKKKGKLFKSHQVDEQASSNKMWTVEVVIRI